MLGITKVKFIQYLILKNKRTGAWRKKSTRPFLAVSLEEEMDEAQ